MVSARSRGPEPHLAIYDLRDMGRGKDRAREANLGIHVGEEGGQLEQERLPAAAVRRGAAGPLGRRVVVVRGGRGRREELVGEDG